MENNENMICGDIDVAALSKKFMDYFTNENVD